MWSHRTEMSLYGVVLRAYPREFRARFGAEMSDAFAEEIRDERSRHGRQGALRVWRSALWEVVSVAGPLQLRGSMAPALAISLLASSVFALAFFAAVTPHCVR